MSKPTREEYEASKAKQELLRDLIDRANRHIMELIDSLAADKKALDFYKTKLQEFNEIIFKYEEYERLEKENGKSGKKSEGKTE